MVTIFKGYFFVFSYIILVIFSAIYFGKNIWDNVEISRKIIHFGISFTWIIIYIFFKNSIHFFLIPFIFFVINCLLFLYSKKLEERDVGRKYISYIEREGNRRAPGIVYYALSITIMALISLLDHSYMISYAIGLFCMSVGDCMAGIIGSRGCGIWGYRYFGDKSVAGTISCMVFSSLITVIILICFGLKISVTKIFVIGFVAGVFELPGRGLDNLTIPIGCMIVSHMMGMY